MASRSVRGSRNSSPFVSTPKTSIPESRNKIGNESAVASTQTLLDKWVEPALPQPRPSFADAGIERHGAVAGMMPLGTLPSSKQMRVLAVHEGGEAMGRSSSQKRSGLSNASTPAPSVMTPEPTVNTTQPPSPPERVLEETPESQQTPERQASPAKVRSSPEPDVPTPVQTVEREIFAPIPKHPTPPRMIDRDPTPQPELELPSRLYSGSPVIPPAVPVGPDGFPLTNLDQTDKVIEAAVQEAVDRKRYPTAYAVRILYDQKRSDPSFIRLIEAVYYNFASEETLDEFQRLLRPKKREGRKDRTGEYYFIGDGDPAPPPQMSTPSIADTVLALFPPPPKEYKTPYSSMPMFAPQRSGSIAADTPPSMNHSSNPESPPQPPKGKETEMNVDEHVTKKQKTSNFQAVNVAPVASMMMMNGTSSASESANETMAKSQSPVPLPVSAPVPAPEPASASASASASTPVSAQPNGSSQPKRRSNSQSSTSSLSSVDEKLISSTGVSPAKPHPLALSSQPHALARFGAFNFNGGQQPRFVSPYASTDNFIAAASSAETLARSLQPIKPPPKAGPKIHTFSVVSKPVTAPTPTPPPAPPAPSSFVNNFSAINAPDKQKGKGKSTPTEMAPAALLSSNNSSTTTQQVRDFPLSLKLQNKKQLAALQLQAEDPEKRERKNRLKREAKEKTNSIRPPASFERSRINPPSDGENDTGSGDGDSVAVEAPTPPSRRPKLRLTNNSLPKRTTRRGAAAPENDDSSGLSSPTYLGFESRGPPESIPVSRAGTPNNSNRSTRKSKPGSGTGLRVKTSPMKKKGGTLAGIPRISGDRNSPDRNGFALNQDLDNDDVCTACGGNGELVCCDGQDCTKSFHFQCIDPPMRDRDALPDVSWFCTECEAKHHAPTPVVGDGIFGTLLSNIEIKNPAAFHLPKPSRERFEDVRTGPDGEYEEVTKKYPATKLANRLASIDKPKSAANKNNFEPDKFMTREKEGKSIFCHSCDKPAQEPDRVIWPCSFCDQWWHLDCLPNPLAKEPAWQRPWRCPLHVDDLMLDLPEFLAPAHRHRLIKDAPPVKTALRRGLPNNGQIQIINKPEPERVRQEAIKFVQLNEFGKTFLLSEEGLVLDFIERVKTDRVATAEASKKRSREQSDADDLSIEPESSNKRRKIINPSKLSTREIREYEAALSLEAMKRTMPELQQFDSAMQDLVRDAPPELLYLVAKPSVEKLLEKAPTPNGEQKQVLIALKAWVDAQVAAFDSPSSSAKTGSSQSAPADRMASPTTAAEDNTTTSKPAATVSSAMGNTTA